MFSDSVHLGPRRVIFFRCQWNKGLMQPIPKFLTASSKVPVTWNAFLHCIHKVLSSNLVLKISYTDSGLLRSFVVSVNWHQKILSNWATKFLTYSLITPATLIKRASYDLNEEMKNLPQYSSHLKTQGARRLTWTNFEVSQPCCVDQLYNQKICINPYPANVENMVNCY